ncbi:MAG: cell division protein FtsL [Rhodocyclaceae bacterium]|nr:cell division protein FtsL [Rhodocyclaceae bacterium]MBX3670184.1 cell division protein FtsL [Rhodocyclaceae bacterium]
MGRLHAFLLALAVCSALGGVASQHHARELFKQLEYEQGRMRALDVEWGQLQIEASTWASHIRIEKLARQRLDMRPPRPDRIIGVDVTAKAR